MSSICEYSILWIGMPPGIFVGDGKLEKDVKVVKKASVTFQKNIWLKLL
jgi:hypothetical protein